MTDTEIAWLAGWLEGEGYFGYNNGSPFIRAKSVDYDTLLKVQATAGKGNIRVEHTDKEHHKDTWEWAVFGINAVNVMLAIRDYMGERRTSKIDRALSLTNLDRYGIVLT